LTETRRLTYISSLVGIRQVVLAVNKMDLVSYSNEAFGRIAGQYSAFAAKLGLNDVSSFPICAARGDTVFRRGPTMPWYTGPTLVEHLERVRVDDDVAAKAAPPSVADRFEATVMWMSDAPLLRGRSYLLKIGTQKTSATVAPLKYKINVDTLEHVAAQTLG